MIDCELSAEISVSNGENKQIFGSVSIHEFVVGKYSGQTGVLLDCHLVARVGQDG